MLDSAVNSICVRAGWKEPYANEEGVYAFDLEGNLSFTLSSPDGERLLARSALLSPQAGLEIAGETLAAVMHIFAARFPRLIAVPALDPVSGELELYAFFSLREAEADAPAIFVESFLNELSFWKAQPALSAPAAFTARR